MRIRTLTMKSFRGFEDATLNLDRPLTVLFGVNGSGKSSVLMASCIALSEVLRNQLVPRNQPRERVWLHNAEDTDIRRGAKDLLLSATLSNGDKTQDVLVNHHPGRIPDVSIPNVGYWQLYGAAPALFIFYEASRDVATGPEAFSSPENGSAAPPPSTRDSLVVGQLKFRSLFQWFKTREDVENELKVSAQNLSLEDPQLAAVRRAITGMLPGFSGLRIQRDPLHMVIRKGDETLVVDQLSDGERLLLALSADLARRLAMAYANHDGDPLQGEAVVLIDEIELHLHPAWQRRVLGTLRSTFPNCQFIVTTHSPQVLSEVPNDAVLLVQDFQFFHPAAPTEGRDTNAILWEVLGVTARPQRIVSQLDEITRLLDDGKHDDARKRLDSLAQTLTDRDSEVARLRGLLDLVERIDASDHEGA